MNTRHAATRDLPSAARTLRTYRAAALLTQAELGERAGCARETIAYAETGRALSAPVAVRLSEALGCPLDALLTPGNSNGPATNGAAAKTGEATADECQV